MKEYLKPRNIPNFLSAYRVAAFPVLLYTILVEYQEAFVWLLCINLITDILDGFLARTFKWETELGARLDSAADIGTYIAAFFGMFIFAHEFFMDMLPEFITLIVLFLLPQIVSAFRFGRLTSMHLYSSKTGGYLQGIFFFCFFTIGYSLWYFHFMIVFSCLAFLEALIIVTFIPELRSNVKGLYWMLKEHKAIR